ncbi:hypothetical protein GQ457_02G021870 [Hibiscus cannabinus]
MASLVLLLSELVRHHEPDFAFAFAFAAQSSTTATTTTSSSPPPLSCGASMSNKSLRNDARMFEWESVEEDPQQQRVSVDMALML